MLAAFGGEWVGSCATAGGWADEAGQDEEDDRAMAGELLSPHPQQGWEADVTTSLPSGLL